MDKKTDLYLGIFFLTLILAFIGISMTHPTFFDWVFERHHNQWSWYLRPLFLIPFCYFAYRESFAGMMISLFALFTSMFWFPKPAVVSDQVIEFLAFEKEYLYGEWNLQKILLTLTIPISLTALGLAFWKRSLWIGIGVIILMATGKMSWGVQTVGQAGYSIFVPAIIGMIICIGLILYGYFKIRK